MWVKRHLTPDQELRGQPARDTRAAIRSTKSGASTPMAICCRMSSAITGIDDNGQAGIERGLDDSLRGRQEPLQLSIDMRLQYILHEELQRVVDDFTAKGGAGLIMNVNTGEVLAMVSLPDFDPSHPGTPDPAHPNIPVADRMFNRVTLGDYEIGSVFKIFTTAMGLDSGATTMTGVFDATHPIHIGRFTISDYHGKHRPLTVPEILMYSSNIGEAKIALAVGADAAAGISAPLRAADLAEFRAEGDRQAALSGEVARGQRHDDRLWPRHFRDPAADRQRGLGAGQWRRAAPGDPAQTAARRRAGRPPGDLAGNLGPDAQAVADGCPLWHRRDGRCAGLCRRRQDRHRRQSRRAGTMPSTSCCRALSASSR